MGHSFLSNMAHLDELFINRLSQFGLYKINFTKHLDELSREAEVNYGIN